jgi:hypothetical protein
MLEQAHERQFAISQLGTRSVGFEAEHINRIHVALQMLNECITTQHHEEPCRPNSPHVDELFDLRRLSQNYTALPKLELASHSPSPSSSPSPTIPFNKSRRSPMALQELMNPAPLLTSTLKRKAMNDYTPFILPDDELHELADLDHDILFDHAEQIRYHRAYQIMGDAASARTRRVVRMRRSQSVIRRTTQEQCHEHDQLEKDGHLLLSLSQSFATTSG